MLSEVSFYLGPSLSVPWSDVVLRSMEKSFFTPPRALCWRSCSRGMVSDTHASVGVVSCRDGVCPGYTLLAVSRTTYLIDKEGRVLHTWASRREVFVAYLLPSGNLLRDGSDLELAPQFVAGGASGYLEEVTWHNELVWSWSALPRFASLSHHDVTPLPNGNVLVLVWERKNKEQALAAGRHPELLPDGEVWDNCVVELRPDPASGRACEVHRWSQWDHLVQDFDPSKANYVEDVAAHPTKFDLNYAPPGGKAACRSGGLQPDEHPSVGRTGLEPQPGRLRIDLPLTRASSALDRASRCSTRLPGRRCAWARHTCTACSCVPEEAATPSITGCSPVRCVAASEAAALCGCRASATGCTPTASTGPWGPTA